MFADFLTNIIAYPFIVVFIRLTGILITAPLYSDKTLPTPIKFTMAFMIALALAPSVSEFIPVPSNSLSFITGTVFFELLIGILLGLSARLFMFAVTIAGDFMSNLMGLQAASMFDPASGTNTVAISKLLSLIALAAFIALNMHLYMLEAFVQSYTIIPINSGLDMGEVVYAVIATVTKVTILGIKMAAPVVILNFLVNLALGVLNRLVPQIQVFFISMPLTMLVGIFILALTITSMIILFTEEIENNMIIFSQTKN